MHLLAQHVKRAVQTLEVKTNDTEQIQQEVMGIGGQLRSDQGYVSYQLHGVNA